MTELVSVSEAARRLGINKSTVSRQVRQLGQARPDGKVDLAAYTKAREGLNPLMARGHGVLGYEASLAEPSGNEAATRSANLNDDAPREPTAADKARAGLAQAHVAEKAIKARTAALTLHEKESKLAPIAEVRRAFDGLAKLMQERLARRNRELAERFAVSAEVAQIESWLDEADRIVLAEIAREARGMLAARQAGADPNARPAAAD